MKRKADRNHKLRHIVLRMSIYAFTVLFVAFAVVLFGLWNDARNSSRAHIDAIADSAGHSLSLINNRITRAAARLSIFDPFVCLCAGISGNPLEDYMRAADAVSFTVGYLDDVRDICLVTSGREIINFFSGYANEYLDAILMGDIYDFQSGSISDTLYYFPGYPSKFGDLFLYFCPVIRIDPQNIIKERVGTLVLSCETEALSSLLRSVSLDCDYSCSVLNSRGDTAIKSGFYDASGDSSPYIVERDAGGLKLSISVPSSVIVRRDNIIYGVRILGAAMLFLLLAQIYYSRVLKKNLTDPVDRLVSAITSVARSNNPDAFPPSDVEEIDLITDNIRSLVIQLSDMSRESVRREHEIIEAELRKNEAELYALQSQINPHFLFNTLQCIRSLAILKDDRSIAVVCGSMSSILRYSLSESHIVSVEKEISVTEKYLDICRIRYQGRHEYRMLLPQELYVYSCLRLILQPLVENAVLHGLSMNENGGTVMITGHIESNTLILEVVDNGAAIPPDKLREIRNALNGYIQNLEGNSGQSFGLLNIHRRIQLEYGEDFGLSISEKDGWKYFTVRIPAVRFNSVGTRPLSGPA